MQDIILKSRQDISPEMADDEVFDRLRQLTAEYDVEAHHGERLRVHIVLHSAGLVNTFRCTQLSEEFSRNVELYAYTLADIDVMQALGIFGNGKNRLDRRAITYSSNTIVHLVIFGCSSHAESLAIFASLLCHFPNYCRDEKLHTRITWISDSIDDFTSFRKKCKGLLDQCFVRTMVEVEGGIACKSMVLPKYYGKRKDFIDVEWEFVQMQPSCEAVTYKLAKWSEDNEQELTIAFCYDDDNRNIDCAMSMPLQVYDLSQMFVKTKSAGALQLLKKTDKFHNVITFGNVSVESSELGNVIRMAQCVNYAYNNMREGTTPDNMAMMVPLDLPGNDVLQDLWNNPKLTTAKRWSNIFNAITVLPKMRSLELHPDEWDNLVSLPKSDIDRLAEVEHNRWCVEELILGFVPTTMEEHQRITTDINERARLKASFVHDDLRNFHELGEDETGQSVVRYDYGVTKCLPLIAYAYYHAKGGCR